MTIIEKIISKHTKDKVRVGKTLWLDIDVRSARDFGGANVVKNLRTYYKGDEIKDPEKTFFTFDCVAPANNIPYANNQHICRKFAREKNIRVYDVDRGIGSHVLIEEGIAFPGSTVVGTDSHMNILGAIGAFGQGMGDIDIAFAFKTGMVWFDVPPTMKVILKGKPSKYASSKDIVLKILQKLGASGALGKVIELYGDIVPELSLDERITISSMATEMGAIALFITPNKEVIEYCTKRAKFDDSYLDLIFADKNAQYCETIEINIDELLPLISLPGNPEKVVCVDDVRDVPVDGVFIGSCTNGRVEDFLAVRDTLKGKKVSSNVMAKITPATKEVFSYLVKNGIIAELFDGGFIISHQGCGGCASGQLGMTGKGEVQVSTSNRNFYGKQGDGETYLASPQTATASAIAGKIIGKHRLEG